MLFIKQENKIGSWEPLFKYSAFVIFLKGHLATTTNHDFGVSRPSNSLSVPMGKSDTFSVVQFYFCKEQI